MKDKYTVYEHHGQRVTVQKSLKGRHRQYCLCRDCKNLDTVDEQHNCPIANELFSVCCVFHIVTPVWECPDFEPKEEAK